MTTHEPLLSVCIPTFNRRELLEPLVKSLLGRCDIEVCIYDDGSSDGTGELLAELANASPQVRVSGGPNSGRATALLRASSLASGKFIMIYDDDDLVLPGGLAVVLSRCQDGVPFGVCGFIFRMADSSGVPIGMEFPRERSNFLKLRGDDGIKGDHKEVILRPLLLDALQRRNTGSRRIPTSLYWSDIAINYDVICDDAVVGVKKYYVDGISAKISQVKRENLRPLIMLHDIVVRGFWAGRYRSVIYLLRSVLAALYYRLALCLRMRA